MFFKQWAYPSLLKCCGKCTSVKRGVDNVSKRRYDRRRFNKKLYCGLYSTQYCLICKIVYMKILAI